MVLWLVVKRKVKVTRGRHPAECEALAQDLIYHEKILCKRYAFHRMTAGFTLVELAIVLVIISLVGGGVLVGKDLIASAQMRRLVSDYQQYEAAYNTFKIKYNCVVGDCAQATQIFGSATSNGDGNGLIRVNYETRQVCQQLGLAGLVNANCQAWFPLNGGNGGIVAGVNALPVHYTSKLPLEMEIGMPSYLGAGSYVDTKDTGGMINLIYMAQEAPAANNYYPRDVWGGGITTTEAKSLDEKMDDGKPFTGRMVQYNWANLCGVYSTNTYNTASASPCPSYYKVGN